MYFVEACYQSDQPTGVQLHYTHGFVGTQASLGLIQQLL